MIKENFTQYRNAIIERFKTNAYIVELEKNIQDYTEKLVFEKYKGTIILRGGLNYELFRVIAIVDTYTFDIKPRTIILNLIYTIISKTNSYEKKVLKNAKDKCNRMGMGYYNGKKKLWIEEEYQIEPELVIENKINLYIENTK